MLGPRSGLLRTLHPSERAHVCPTCGLILDRDVNAVRNILALSLERALIEAETLLPRGFGWTFDVGGPFFSGVCPSTRFSPFS